MSIVLKDGTVLPGFSDYDAFPYYIVKEGAPMLVASKAPFWYVPSAIMNALAGVSFDAIGSISAGAYYTLNGDEWVLYTSAAFGELFFSATTPLHWSNHNIGVVKTIDQGTLEVTGTGEIYFKNCNVFILPDGTELPALPDGCFDETPYGVITTHVNDNASAAILSATSSPCCAASDELTESVVHVGDQIVSPAGKRFVAFYAEASGSSWNIVGVSEVETPFSSGSMNDVKWANHDLLTATAKNADGSYTIGTEIARKSDENYRVTGGYMTSIANEARRLGGKTGGMLPAVTEETLRGVTAGGDEPTNAEDMIFGTTISGKDLYTGKYFYGTYRPAIVPPSWDANTYPYAIFVSNWQGNPTIFVSDREFVRSNASETRIQFSGTTTYMSSQYDETNKIWGDFSEATTGGSSTSINVMGYYWANYDYIHPNSGTVTLAGSVPIPETKVGAEIEYIEVDGTYTISGATLNALGAVTQQITGIEATTPSAMVAALQMYAGTH